MLCVCVSSGVDLPSAEQEQRDDADDGDHDEHQNADRRGVARVFPAEVEQVHDRGHGCGRIARTAVRHRDDDVEQLQPADEIEHHADRQRTARSAARSRGGSGRMPCAVDRRRFVIILRNRLQAGQEEHHRDAQILIRVDERDDPAVEVLVAEQIRGFVLEQQQDIVDGAAVVLEEEVPDVAHDQRADDDGQINDRPHDAARPDVHVQEQGVREADEVLQEGAADPVNDRVPDDPAHVGVAEDAFVIRTADPFEILVVAVPVRERNLNAFQERIEE